MIQKQNNTTKSYTTAPSITIDQSKTYIATLKTTQGDIKIQLDAVNAPTTVNSFVFLAKDDFYDGVIFHRVIAGFMAQGGDPTGTGMGDAGYKFNDEIHKENKNNKGTIAMANSGPNTNGSQFFINVADNNYLDGRHTVFGKVTEGMDIVDKIVNVETDYQDKPIEDVVITDVMIEIK
ncbi:peptidylprolyl isomerase [Candidatus Dojkabacteria bacterium]|nr:peptidylprolyl isomerase [Candidatus Dojkabacteria bacterium]